MTFNVQAKSCQISFDRIKNTICIRKSPNFFNEIYFYFYYLLDRKVGQMAADGC